MLTSPTAKIPGVEVSKLAVLTTTCFFSSARPQSAIGPSFGLQPSRTKSASSGSSRESPSLSRTVRAASFETSTPGIFAVGDVNTYPGKQKLIVCGFHEATLAAFAIGELVHPERAQPLQYTTTSTKLHKLLGVAP